MTDRPISTARPSLWLLLVFGLVLFGTCFEVKASDEAPLRLTIEPSEIRLDGARSEAQVIITGYFADGSVRDLSAEAEMRTEGTPVVRIESGGRMVPAADGRSALVARVRNVEASAIVEVTQADVDHLRRFEHEVLPALTKAGCNQGACHGTPTGKDGFRLSLRGYDPVLDYQSLAREIGHRRVNPFDPESSLLLLKGTGSVPHQGGKRFSPGDPTYQVLRDWIAEGLRPEPGDLPKPVRLEVLPSDRVLDLPSESQQLAARVIGSKRGHDRTRRARPQGRHRRDDDPNQLRDTGSHHSPDLPGTGGRVHLVRSTDEQPD